MHSTGKTQAGVAKKIDAAVKALARELQGFVLDTAKLIAPMVKDGRLKGRDAVAVKVEKAYKTNKFVQRFPWQAHRHDASKGRDVTVEDVFYKVVNESEFKEGP